MYCQTCGTEIQTGLNYCNRCGGAVNVSLAARPPETGLVDLKSPVRTLGATIALTTLIGFATLFIGIGGLTSKGLPPELLAMMGVLGLFLILIVDVLLIRILSRLVQLPVAAAASLPQTQLKRPEARELASPQTQTYMPAATDPLSAVGSVTEHTTRTFHPVYKEPHANR